MPKNVLFDREEVIARVSDLFWRKGYNGTSMQDLVDTTGLNRSSLYNSFGDKFQLFEEALKHYQGSQNQFLREAFSEAKSPKQAIISLFRGISEDIKAGNQKGCMITACTSELAGEVPQIKDFLIENKERVVASFTALIEGAQQLGEIDASRDPRVLALYLFSSLQGLRVTSMIEPDLEEVAEEVLTVL